MNIKCLLFKHKIKNMEKAEFDLYYCDRCGYGFESILKFKGLRKWKYELL